MESLYQGVRDVSFKIIEESGEPLETIQSILQTLKLVDSDRRFLVPALEKTDLLDDVDIKDFIDAIIANVSKNPYLNRFMKVIGGEVFDFGPKQEVYKIVWEALCYAVVLERLSRSFRADVELTRAIQEHWSGFTEELAEQAQLNAFERSKAKLMDGTLKHWIQSYESKKISEKRGRYRIPINVIIALMEDARLGFCDNARAGLILACNPPGSSTRSELTQAAPSRYSDHGNMTLMAPPLPTQWNDLYLTWNLAFCAHYRNFPFFFAKLLIPFVSGYRDCPAGFISSRSTALFIHVKFHIFTQAEFHQSTSATKSTRLTMSNPKLIKKWAASNLKSAREYQKELYSIEPTCWRKIQGALLGISEWF